MKRSLKFNRNKIWIIVGSVLVIILGLSAYLKFNNVLVSSVVIKLEPTEGTYFLDDSHVLRLATGEGQATLIGTKSSELPSYEILLRLKSSPYVADASIRLNLNGKLHVYVKQREPLFRVINQHGESYYVEKSGMKIPFLQNYPIRVPVLSGMIEETMSDSTFVKSRLLQEAILLFKEIRSDAFLDAQIEQVYVDKFKDFLLIPKVGNHTIVMGNTERLSDKLHALNLFYHEALNKLGWDIYREIDLRYKGQIVARK